MTQTSFTKLELYCLQHDLEQKRKQAASRERRSRRRAFWAQQASRTSGVLADRETYRNGQQDVWVHRTQDSHFERSGAGGAWRQISRDAYLLRLSGGGFRKAKLPLF